MSLETKVEVQTLPYQFTRNSPYCHSPKTSTENFQDEELRCANLTYVQSVTIFASKYTAASVLVQRLRDQTLTPDNTAQHSLILRLAWLLIQCFLWNAVVFSLGGKTGWAIQ